MKREFAALLVFALCSCHSPDRDSVPFRGFSVAPFGRDNEVTEIGAQTGDAIASPISVGDFREFTIAQGSGMAGFDAIRVFGDRTGYIVFAEEGQRKNTKVLIALTEAEVAGLLAALNEDRVDSIKGFYAAGVFDGSQGFLEIATDSGRRFSWLDNYFRPVANTFDFCNRVIWPKVGSGRIEGTGIDRQAEYFRVFPQ